MPPAGIIAADAVANVRGRFLRGESRWASVTPQEQTHPHPDAIKQPSKRDPKATKKHAAERWGSVWMTWRGGESTIMIKLARMEITDRFGKVWHEWDARVAAGESPQSILAAASDEQLLYLLGSESKGDRKYARDIIVTALLNRRHRRGRDASHEAARVLRTADAASQAARTGQAAIHEAEALLREHGQDVRGTALSDSAFSSLAATKAAFESARAQAERFRETLLGSEAGAKLADAAAKASHSADEAAEDLEERMAGFGRGAEGRAAAEALRSISRTSDDAAAAAGERARGLQEKAREAQRRDYESATGR